ncbi:dihydrolipoyl dehydrogenase [Polyangium fumosum]|uniref:Dihydrolipoyl dehydrogenase n=1 Tax=Polyangium fumosum TaxID=889272 RepID=A0A4U1J9V8_9BACT|nr:dihydrolipoyl dehydrogenase [Polyangium fumosum]TKD05203.1 dihydrolipoyl dehydrogenase [Polyangium fumosum]
MKTYDAIVIGSGPGGYVCAIRLGQLKQKTLCIEKEEVGGVCLNWGCIPSKALINAAHTYEKAHSSMATMGIKLGSVEHDPNAMQDWKEGIVKRLTGGVRGLLKSNGADLMAGTATIVSPNRIEVKKADGSVETIEATKGIVLATGSTTIEIPSFKFDGKQIIGAKEAVSLREVPKRLLVIGGGVIGLELGMVYQAFGAELVVVEAMPTLLTGVDQDCVKVVERRIQKRGGKIYKNAKAMGYEKQADGSVAVKLDVEGKPETVVTDMVLVAVGMRPNSRGLGLENVGVNIDKRGFVPSDEFGRTNIPTIYSIGDVSGPPMLAHKASKEGEVIAEVIAGHKAAKDWACIPGAIFTDPEIATAGLTAEEAQAKGIEVSVGKFPFAALGKAMAMMETDGFVKVVTDKKTKQVLGVHIVGPEASTMISEGALALEMAAFAEDIALTIHPHPTLGEAFMEAAAHAMGAAIHIVNR